MLRLMLTLAATTLFAAALGAAPSPTFPYPHRVETLANGLKVIMVPMPSDGLVAYYSVVRTGSRDEVEPGHTGFAHFFEHMMFRGTARFPVYDKVTTEMGANANAFTSDDLTAYHLVFAAQDLERVIELEADRFQNLSYPEQAFQTEAGAVYGEYRKGRTNPFFRLYEALQNAAFDVHTYKHTTIGFEADIAAMPTMYDYSRSFFSRFYRPDNVVLVIAGDIEPDRVMGLVREHYAGWKPGYQAPEIPIEPQQTAERFVEVEYEGRTLPLLAVTWKGAAFDPGDRDTVAGLLLGDLLFGETSPLYRELVLERQLVQRLMTDFGLSRDPSLWGVIAMISDEARIDEVRQAIQQAAEAARTTPPDAARLEDLKRRNRYAFLMNLDTPDRVAGSLARYVAITGGMKSVDQFFATMEAVTPADVQRAAERFLAPKRRTVGLLKGVSQ